MTSEIDLNKSLLSNNSEDKMGVFIRNGRRYYTTRREAQLARKRGQRILYSIKYRAYYIINMDRPSFWSW